MLLVRYLSPKPAAKSRMKDMPQFSLSVLDQSPVRAGATPADAVAETIRLAQATERFGYARFWLAEHHGTDGLASSSPELKIGRRSCGKEWGSTCRLRRSS